MMIMMSTMMTMTVMIIFICECIRHLQSLPILTDNRDTAYLKHNGFLFNTDASLVIIIASVL